MKSLKKFFALCLTLALVWFLNVMYPMKMK